MGTSGMCNSHYGRYMDVEIIFLYTGICLTLFPYYYVGNIRGKMVFLSTVVLRKLKKQKKHITK